ncbi:MAG: NADH-quinone oxidoreductase subunit C [Dehalococcoidia bacterium]|nr:NADH-quinone oxidoreductase subunit C [Dehalococcoidia bacterium]
MIRPMSGEELGRHVQVVLPSAVEQWDGLSLWIKPESVLDTCRFLKETQGLEFDLLNSISAVDYVEQFELVYHLTSTQHSHSAVLKTKVFGRTNPTVPSVVGVWQGADFQEREIWDLMGIGFSGHPNLKRIMLWEGFQGHPLRRDYLEPPR